jgi:hypothetical protein
MDEEFRERLNTMLEDLDGLYEQHFSGLYDPNGTRQEVEIMKSNIRRLLDEVLELYYL